MKSTIVILFFLAILICARCLECEKGYFEESGLCQQCPAECLSCLNPIQCDECENGSFLLGGTCVIECPRTFLTRRDPIDGKKLVCVKPNYEVNQTHPYLTNHSYVMNCSRDETDTIGLEIRNSSSIFVFGWAKVLGEANENWFLEISLSNNSWLMSHYWDEKKNFLRVSNSESQIRFVSQLRPPSKSFWIFFNIRLTIEALTFENGIQSSEIDFKAKEGDYLIISLGETRKGKFIGLLRNVQVHLDPDFPNSFSNFPYGVQEKLIEMPMLVGTNNETIIIGRNATASIDIDFEGLVTIFFRIEILRQDIFSVYEPCDLFTIYDREDGHLLLRSQFPFIESPTFTTGENLFIYSRNKNEVAIWQSMFYDEDTKNLFTFKPEEQILNASGKFKIVLGGTENNGCSFLPFHIMVYKGGGNFYPKANNERCHIYEASQNECLRCQLTYTYDFEKKTCGPAKCSDGCKECLDSFCPSKYGAPSRFPHCLKDNMIKCIQCEDGYEIDDLYCKKGCPPGESVSINLDTLEEKCESANMENCEKYEIGIIPDNFQCKKCKAGLVASTQGECVEKCPVNQFVHNGKCVIRCPEGTKKFENGTCYDCLIPGCSNCDPGLDICTKCLPNFYLMETNCMHSYCMYDPIEQELCYECPSSCVTCIKGYSGLACTKCKLGYYLLTGKCVDKCPSRMVPSPAGDCVECKVPFPLPNGTVTCSTICPGGYAPFPAVINKTSMTCIKCPRGCQTCMKDFNTEGIIRLDMSCFVCDEGFSLFYGTCLEKCPDYSYTNSKYKMDIKQNCLFRDLKCKDWYKTECFCSDSNPYFELVQSDSRCRPSRIKAFFQSKFLPSIIFKESSEAKYYQIRYKNIFPKDSCQSGCLNCSTNRNCLLCEPGLFLNYHGSCLNRCPVGFYPEEKGRICLKCPIGCISCESLDKCTKCEFELVLENNTCIQSAGKGPTYSESFSFYLQRVGESGLEERKLNLQTSWRTVSFLEPSDLSQLYFRNTLLKNFGKSNSRSTPLCPISCLFCSGEFQETVHTCIQCPSRLSNAIIQGLECICPPNLPFYDHETQRCVASCPPNTLLINQTKECVTSCLSPSAFDAENYYIFQHENYCLPSCPEGYYAEVEYAFEEEIICVRNPTGELYDAINLRTHQFFNISQSCKSLNGNEICHLESILSSNLDVQIQAEIRQYVMTMLSKDENVLDIRMQPSGFLYLHYYYSLLSKMDTKTNIKEDIQKLKILGSLCNSPEHPYHILSIIDGFLDGKEFQFKQSSNNLVILEPVIECFQGLSRETITNHPLFYEGKNLKCSIIQILRTNLTEFISFWVESDSINYRLIMNTLSNMISPFEILQCNLSQAKENSPTIFYLGLTTYFDEEKWWFANGKFFPSFDSKTHELYYWNEAGLQWNQTVSDDDKGITFNFSIAREANNLTFLLVPKDFEFIPLVVEPEKSPSVVYLVSLGVFIFIVIIGGCVVVLTRYSEDIERKKRSRKYELKSEESQIELGRNIEDDEELEIVE